MLDAVEVAGYRKATKALLNGSKLKDLGWKPFYYIGKGIPRTIDILKKHYTRNNLATWFLLPVKSHVRQTLCYFIQLHAVRKRRSLFGFVASGV